MRSHESPGSSAAAVFVVVLAVLGGNPGGVWADEKADAIAKINQLCDDAAVAFGAEEWDDAKARALDAITLGLKSGLASHEVMGKAYLHLGAIYVAGFQDKVRARNNFLLAVKAQPGIKPSGKIATREVNEVFVASVGQVAAAAPAPKPAPPPPPPPPPAAKAPAPKADEEEEEEDETKPAPKPVVAKPVAPAKPSKPPPPEEPDLPAKIPTPLHCPNADEAPPGVAIALRCVAQPDLDVARVLLFYRPPGAETFTIAPTTRSPKGWFNVAIPASASAGKSLQYYFEARDASDQVRANAGRNDSPNIIIIREGAAPVGSGALAILRYQKGEAGVPKDEDPLAALKAAQARQGQEEDTGEARWWVGLGVGWGHGFAPKRAFEWRDDLTAQAGGNSTGLHLSPEVGYRYSNHVAFAITLRNQIILDGSKDPDRTGAPAKGAQSGLLRVLYLFGTPDLRFFVSGMLGGGEGLRIVHPADVDKGRKAYDTVVVGPVLVGAGGGVFWNLSGGVGLVGEVKALVGLPSTGLGVDLDLGVRVGL